MRRDRDLTVEPGIRTQRDDGLVSFPGKDPSCAYESGRTQAERQWVPSTQQLLGIATHDLPTICDADFLYGPKTDAGDDTYVLCEINVQAVWPYPPRASTRLAQAALDRALAAKSARP